ncbi:unnamed protein product, partial [Mesorhabditis belari]|uniref:Uncharacterized protein n=1 Tax=Mesorhabditis belari TaxID=2138241 RepID=A0AAF3EYH0_9BILA
MSVVESTSRFNFHWSSAALRDYGASKATEPSPTRRPAPPPPPPPSQSVQEKRIEPSITDSQSSMQTRKSLSAQFLEQQARQQIDLLPPLPPPITTLPPALLSPKPYGDDATVRTESEDEGTEVSENGDIQEENQESGERRGRASTSDSAVSVNSSQSDYSVEEEEPYGRKTGKYTFFKEVKEEKEEKIEVITRKVIEREFDVDSLEEKEEEVEEIPDEEAIKKHLEKEKEEAIVEMPIKLQMPDLSDDSEDEEVPPLTLLHSFPNQSIALMAGDGNPVRNSLISLVMEEDIPLLLEAMSENPKFEFVDLMEASTSSILHPPEKRKQRRTERQVSRISFVTGTPDVFTYLDERSAERENNWIDGTPVSYDVYQSICNEEQQEQVRQLEELERWKQNIQERQNRVEMDPDDNEMARGVTSHLSYQTGIPESARISV